MAVYLLTRDPAPSDLAGLAASHTATDEQVRVLRELAADGASILVTGAAHSGKTNLMRCLTSAVPSSTSIAWVGPEGVLPQSSRRIASPATSTPYLPGALVVDAPDHETGHALRMVLDPGADLDRSSPGPVLTRRSGGMLAVAIGARSATGALARLAELVGRGEDDPSENRALVAHAVDVVVVCGFRREDDGTRRRRVVEIVSVVGVEGEEFHTGALSPVGVEGTPRFDELVAAHQRGVAADLLEIVGVYLRNGVRVRTAFEMAGESDGPVGILAEDILAHTPASATLTQMLRAAPALQLPLIIALAQISAVGEIPRFDAGVARLREMGERARRYGFETDPAIEHWVEEREGASFARV